MLIYNHEFCHVIFPFFLVINFTKMDSKTDFILFLKNLLSFRKLGNIKFDQVKKFKVIR